MPTYGPPSAAHIWPKTRFLKWVQICPKKHVTNFRSGLFVISCSDKPQNAVKGLFLRKSKIHLKSKVIIPSIIRSPNREPFNSRCEALQYLKTYQLIELYGHCLHLCIEIWKWITAGESTNTNSPFWHFSTFWNFWAISKIARKCQNKYFEIFLMSESFSYHPYIKG